MAIDADTRVTELKGPTRPVNNETERRLLLENLKSVDEVKIFHSDQDLVDIIKECSIMVKGSDYVGKPIVGAEYCKEIKFFNRINEYSTTNKIQHIINR